MRSEEAFADWAEILPDQLQQGLDSQFHGDIVKWQAAVDQLPNLTASSIDLTADKVRAGQLDDIDEQQQAALKQQLMQLHPWRKGPFELFGLHLNTEWHSDWKWDRLKDHIEPLTGRTVLDVGCGNGYHCWRMAGAGAKLVVGLEPMMIYNTQFLAMNKFLKQDTVFMLPFPLEAMPKELKAFDTVFSMGVLYHRRSPIDHLYELKELAKQGGEVVLETLVIDGRKGEVLVPDDRYAKMRNVWFIPTVLTLESWLQRCGYKNIQLIDVTKTSLEEQRVTPWMEFESLKEFLDPDDFEKTIEGYPAPRRAIFICSV